MSEKMCRVELDAVDPGDPDFVAFLEEKNITIVVLVKHYYMITVYNTENDTISLKLNGTEVQSLNRTENETIYFKILTGNAMLNISRAN
jgi:hypothetical protein